jgi:hypothetical protein
MLHLGKDASLLYLDETQTDQKDNWKHYLKYLINTVQEVLPW